MTTLDFTVFGIAAPQGSMRAFMRKGGKFPVVTTDNAKMKPWRQEVTMTALAERERQDFELAPRPNAIRVQLAFFFEKPKSVRSWEKAKTTRPDCDKLARCVLDALSGVLFEDDAQVVALSCSKAFGSPARMDARIETVEK